MSGSIAHLLADVIVLLHFTFVVFVVAGGFLVLRWPRVMWAHIPAAFWGAVVEFAGWICPLTPLENALRTAAGEASYRQDFVGRYVVPVLYPDGLTRDAQIALGAAVVILNAVIYLIVLRRRHPVEARG